MSSEVPQTDLQFLQQFEPEVFWEEHGTKIMGTLLAVIVIALGIYLWHKHTEEQAVDASVQLSAAQDISSLNNVISQYADLPAGALARLKLADMLFNQGSYPEAGEQFQQFLAEHPEHPLAVAGQLGLAAVAEAGGELESARDQYQRIITTQSGGFGVVAAKLGAARCSEMLGSTKESRQLYEEVMAVTQRTPFYSIAMMRWTMLGRDLAEPSESAPAAIPGS